MTPHRQGQRPRILSVLPNSNLGGPGFQHLAFVDHLRQEFEVEIALCHEQPAYNDYIAMGLNVHRLRSIPFIPRSVNPVRWLRYLQDSLSAALNLRRIIRDRGIRLIHTFGSAALCVPLAGRLSGVPTATHVIGLTVLQPVWVGRLFCTLHRFLSDRLIGCQELMVEKFKSLGFPPARCELVYHGIDTESIRQRAKEPAERMLDSEPNVNIGLVATLDPRKGHLLFIEAARQVAEARNNAQFFIIGSTRGRDPEYLAQVKSQIEASGFPDRVHFIGSVRDTAPWLSQLDILCNSSLTEALSVAVLEGMALDLPVVATGVGGNPVAVQHGETGFICQPGNGTDLANKILKLVDDGSLRQQLGRNGRLRADQVFDIRPNSKRLGQVFNQLV